MALQSLPDGSARELFDEALQHPAGERAEFVRRACSADDALRAQVEDLLRAYSAAESAFPETPSGEKPGDCIGAYKLLERIGEGGFGTVWMAQQDAPIRRKVALKILKWGMDTRQVVARFEAERQALALMDHPHIAHLLDAGATENGRPYFVMELVHGVPITRYCDEARLSPRERLELFQHVCEAVQHAHQKGIIHRDLKPGNVLVTLQDGRPIPKVIDFGIAKATSGQLTDKTQFTGFLQVMGTPEYMAPEQAEMTGVDVDTRADVYALGVLLYELLTGTKPFDLKQVVPMGMQELLRRIREVEPEKPSTRISTLGERTADVCSRQQVHPRAFSRLLRGDLDWIVLKSLEKERERRYATAERLSADIERHLRDEPVEAGPPSLLYRLRKGLRRHWVGATAVSAVLIAVCAGGVVSWLGYREAVKQEALASAAATRADDERKAAVRAREAEAAERVAAEGAREAESEQRRIAERELATRTQIFEFLQDVLTEFEPGERDMTVREMVDRAAERLEGRLGDDPRVEAEIRGMLAYNYDRMGSPDRAVPHARRRVELLEGALGTDAPDTLTALNDLGRVLPNAAQAEPLVQRVARGRLSALGERDPLTLQAQSNVAANLWAQGRLEEAEAAMLELRRKLAELGVRDATWALLIGNLAIVELDRGRPEDALQTLAEVLPELDGLIEDSDPNRYKPYRTLAAARRATGDLPGAETALAGALTECRQHLGPDHQQVVFFVERLAELLEAQGRYAEAAAEYDALAEVLRERRGPRSSALAAVLHHAAPDLLQSGRAEDAERYVREAAAIYAESPWAPSHEVRHAAQALDDVLTARGAPPAERAQLIRPLLEQLRQRLPADHHDLIWPHALLAKAVHETGEKAEAERLVREAVCIATIRWPEGSPLLRHQLDVRLLLARILIDTQQLDEAEQVLSGIYSACDEAATAAGVKTSSAFGMAEISRRRGDKEGAAAWAERAKATMPADGR